MNDPGPSRLASARAISTIAWSSNSLTGSRSPEMAVAIEPPFCTWPHRGRHTAPDAREMSSHSRRTPPRRRYGGPRGAARGSSATAALWHAQRLQACAHLLEAALLACIHRRLVAFAVTQADGQRDLIRSRHGAERIR